MQDDIHEVTDEDAPTLESSNRANLFAALTGRHAEDIDVSGQGVSVEQMLSSLVGTSSRTKKLDTAEAARVLGVSRRRVQDWLKSEREGRPVRIKSETMTKLRTRSRQAATTKRGRSRAIRGLRSRPRNKPVKVQAYGDQGPRREAIGRPGQKNDYTRERWSTHELTPEQYDGLLKAYEDGGDEGMAAFLSEVWSAKYDDWAFYSLTDFEVN